MNKLIIGLMICMFMLSFASAEQKSLGSFKQGDCVPIIQICSSCTYVNLTHIIINNNDNSTKLIILNVAMEKNGALYNYTFCDTNNFGEYNPGGIGDLDGVDTPWALDFFITPTGSTQTTGQSIGGLAFIILLLATTGGILYLSIRFLDSDVLYPLGIFLFVLFIILITYDVWLAYEFKLNYTGASPDSIIPRTIFSIFVIVMGGGLITAFFLLTIKWEKVVKLFKKAIKPEKNIDVDEIFF